MTSNTKDLLLCMLQIPSKWAKVTRVTEINDSTVLRIKQNMRDHCIMQSRDLIGLAAMVYEPLTNGDH